MKYDNLLRTNTIETYLKSRFDPNLLPFLDVSFRRKKLLSLSNDYTMLFEKYSYQIYKYCNKMKQEIVFEGSKYNFHYLCSNLKDMKISYSQDNSIDPFLNLETDEYKKLIDTASLYIKRIEYFLTHEFNKKYPRCEEGTIEYVKWFIFTKFNGVRAKAYPAYPGGMMKAKPQLPFDKREIFIGNGIVLDILLSSGWNCFSFDKGNTYYKIDKIM